MNKQTMLEAAKSFKMPARTIRPEEFYLFSGKTLLDIVKQSPEMIADDFFKKKQGAWGKQYFVRLGDYLIPITEKTRNILKKGDINVALAMIFREGKGNVSGLPYIRLQPIGGEVLDDNDPIYVPDSVPVEDDEAVMGA